ncbi:leucine-rich repeat protein [Bacteroides stercorirosoris]|uniref:leucine-rich repeat protein n=1 Tax=Bacteroides stercorirosoris TaxID=871324 RepID=UPI00351F9FB3
MKTRRFHQNIVLMAAALATVACQNELKEEYNEPKPGEKITMTIRATQGAASQTRTDYEDKLGIADINNIVVKWEGGSTDGAPVEKIKVFGANANELDYSVGFNSLPSSLSQDGTSISFEGTIETKSFYFAMYPADNCNYSTEGQAIYTSFLGQTQDCAKPMAHLKGFDLMVGRAATAGSYERLKFSHEAAMIRFSLKNMPSTEKITRVSLTAANNKLSSRMYALLADSSIDGLTVGADTESAPVSSLDLDITNHTPSTEPLKAYMMIPPCDLSNDLLTVTVNTESGNTYTGDLTTAAGTLLEAGLCYTLEPTLTLGKTISLPPATAGSLGNTLNNITPAQGQTELAVTGTVNADDITALATFLKETKAEKITAIDLSGISGITDVTGFSGCAKLEKVILPDAAEAIGDNAFEGCTALTTFIQNDPMPADATPATRASISKNIKRIGNSSFKNCTSMTEMFLHADIQSVGNSAFEGCTAMTALIFEGTKATGTGGISLGTGIITGTYPDIKIFLPAITDPAVATAYKTLLEQKPTYYNFAGYGSATTTEEKTNPASYTLIPTVPVETMQFTVKVESGDLKFNIPFPESGVTPAAIMVSWGDGTPVVVVPKGTTLAAGDKFEYTYAAAGTYIITIGSDVTADKQQIPVLNFEQRAGSYNPNKLVSLETPLLNMNCSSLSKAFYSCQKLTTIPGNLFEKNTATTDFSGCFYYCRALQTIPGGLFASNTAATDFNSCFFNCDLLKEIPSELFAKNTEARGFTSCFANCKGLTAIPGNLFEKNTAATDFSNCFYNCILLGSIPKELFASNTAATNFSNCFSSCNALTTIPESLFANNTEATNFDQCFADCIALTTIEARLFANNTVIKSFNYCFYDCTALQTIPEGLFANNAEATSFNYCFANCNGLTAIPGNLFEKNKAATDFRNCFQSCRALKAIPGGLFTNNTAATNFSYCFYGCTGLRTIPEGLFAKNAEAINFNSCFYGCTYMMFNPNIFVDPAAAEQDKLNRFIDKDMDFRNCFYQVNLHNNSGTAPALWSYAKGSGNWTTANCFKGCIMSNSEDIKDYSTWGTPKF